LHNKLAARGGVDKLHDGVGSGGDGNYVAEVLFELMVVVVVWAVVVWRWSVGTFFSKRRGNEIARNYCKKIKGRQMQVEDHSNTIGGSRGGAVVRLGE
jgi:hypothetical protein